jgi:transposase
MRWRFGEKRRMRELERVLGKKTVENEIFAETAKHAHEEKRVPVAPAARG